MADLMTMVMRTLVLSLAFMAVATLTTFKLLDGLSWSWWSVTAPLWATVVPYLVVIRIVKVIGVAREATQRDIVQHNEFGEGVKR